MKNIFVFSSLMMIGTISMAGNVHPQVHLNHFYVMLDSEAYRQVKESSFMTDIFGVYETRTTVRADKSYTGSYFYGQDTYMEVFNADDTLNNPKGNPLGAPHGLAFGVDSAGDAQKIGGLNPQPKEIKRAFTGADGATTMIPWFKMYSITGLEGGTQNLATWLMEYDPAFLEQWHSELKTPLGVSRANVLARYAASLNVNPDQRLFENVIALKIQLPKDEFDSFITIAQTLGCNILTYSETLKVIQTAGQTITTIVANDAKTLSVDFKLRRSLADGAPAEYKFGQTTLTIKDKAAHWEF